MPRTIIPPSPGGHRLDPLATATSARRSAKIRAPPLGSRRSLTFGVKKPAANVAKTEFEVVDAFGADNDNKKVIGFRDLPGGAHEIFC